MDISTTQPFIQAREAAQESWFFGGRTSIRASSRETGGQFAIVEQVCEPGVASPYHVHHQEDEQFYVLEGQLRFVSGEGSWTAGPGTFAFLPRDVPHAFEVIGDTPARFLLMVTPGGFEGFVAALSELAPGPPDMAKVLATAPRYGLEIFGPISK